jgi:HEAT repeat protein
MLDELNSGDDARAEAAVSQLVRFGEAAIGPLIALLDSSIPDQRWWATRALAAHSTPEVWDGLQKALSDHIPSVRQCAALGLRQYPTPSVIPALINALYDHDRLVARLAADALIAIGSMAIPALAKIMETPDPAVRIEAARALAIIEDPQAIHVLFTALRDPSHLVVHWAEQGLERLGVGMIFFKP